MLMLPLTLLDDADFSDAADMPRHWPYAMLATLIRFIADAADCFADFSPCFACRLLRCRCRFAL